MSVEIWGKPACPSCMKAKALCESRGFSFTYKELGKDFDRDEVEDLLEKAGKDLFNKIYKGGTVTVLTKEYFSIWNTIKRAMGSK